jgi:hypothetical protein
LEERRGFLALDERILEIDRFKTIADGSFERRLGAHSRQLPRESPPVHLASMRDSGNDHESLAIVDGVDDEIVPDPDAVIVPTSELGHIHGTRVDGEGVDRSADPISKRTLQRAVLARVQECCARI